MARAPAVLESEAFPEADRLEGLPHPRETVALFGQAPAERALAAGFASGRMHHAWLVTGRQGIGKATLAYRFARHVLAKAEERDALGASLEIAADASAARQVRALSHPGLLVIRRAYDPRAKRFPAAIPVEEVRRLRNFLGHKADEAGWRIVIVDAADELNVNAANALLKSLEEPPARAVFLLISSAPRRLASTVSSRCRTLELSPLTSADLRKAAAQALTAAGREPPAEAHWPDLEQLAYGSVRRLLSLAASGALELNARVTAVLAALPKVDWQMAHGLCDELAAPAAEQRFETFFELLLDALARVVRARAMGGGADAELARRLIADGRLATWAELWETVVREKADALALNLDRRTLILETLSRLEAAARR